MGRGYHEIDAYFYKQEKFYFVCVAVAKDEVKGLECDFLLALTNECEGLCNVRYGRRLNSEGLGRGYARVNRRNREREGTTLPPRRHRVLHSTAADVLAREHDWRAYGASKPEETRDLSTGACRR